MKNRLQGEKNCNEVIFKFNSVQNSINYYIRKVTWHFARDLNRFSQHFPNGNSFHRHNKICTLNNSQLPGVRV